MVPKLPFFFYSEKVSIMVFDCRYFFIFYKIYFFIVYGVTVDCIYSWTLPKGSYVQFCFTRLKLSVFKLHERFKLCILVLLSIKLLNTNCGN